MVLPHTSDAPHGALLQVGRVQEIAAALQALLAKFMLRPVLLPADAVIPGSYWGDAEAGLIGAHIYFRGDTPVHSVLHEACHYICMDRQRRRQLDRDAGGSDAEENAVCYLQILLADYLPGFDRGRMFTDMDAWGYSFRLGSARAWFEQDAQDARQWLLQQCLVSRDMAPTWRLRDQE